MQQLRNPPLTDITGEIWAISASSVFVEGSSTTWLTSVAEDVSEVVIVFVISSFCLDDRSSGVSFKSPSSLPFKQRYVNLHNTVARRRHHMQYTSS